MNENILNLYWNRRSDEFLIQRYKKLYAVGKFIRLPAAAMLENGLQLILHYLRETSFSREDEAPELNTFSKKEEKNFYKEHHHVFVMLSSNTDIAIGPMQKMGAGFVAPKDDIVRISISCTNEEFVIALRSAFERAD
jgi:hypothetical protein